MWSGINPRPQARNKEKRYQCIQIMAIVCPILTRSKMICDIVALASTIMVGVLSSRISFRSGVGSWLSSSMRTDRVSLEMRNCLRSCSRFNKPAGKTHMEKRKKERKEKHERQRITHIEGKNLPRKWYFKCIFKIRIYSQKVKESQQHLESLILQCSMSLNIQCPYTVV